MGRYPLILDSKIQIIRYWLKTIIYKRNPLAYNVYQTMYNNCENGIATEGWTVSIKSLLFNLGLNFVWYNQGVDNFKAFEYLFKQRLQDADIVQWNNRISNSNDGILYKTYKIKPLYSEYINIITKPSHRYYFLKFVTKNHNLPVVLGKWYQPKPYNERLCITCGVLGDEYHFLLQCNKHNDLRSKFIGRYYRENPSMYKFIKLMSSQCHRVIHNLAAFVYIGLQREFK